MEADAIARKFRARAPRGAGKVELASRMPADVRVVGMSGLRLPELSGQAFAGIVMAGLAGGLDPKLEIGEVVVDARSTWRASRLEFKRAEFLTVSDAVTSASQKSELFRQTGAGVVEMENEQVRKLAASYGIPFLGIRAISDAAADSIDPAVLAFIDPFGAVKINEVISEMVRRPSIIKKLRNLSKASAAALERLADAVKEVIDGPGTL
jgi:hypothetical protein